MGDDDAPQLYVPGDDYSPIASLTKVGARADRIFAAPPSLPGIDIRVEAQLALVDEFASRYYDDQPFQAHPGSGARYHFENEMFSYGDALMLYSMLRMLRPAHYVEVGVGFSSALVLDVNDRFLQRRAACHFIDPRPEALLSLATEDDLRRCTVSAAEVQDVAPSVFDALDRNDILFVDSSHVVKPGSDLSTLIFDVLPRLRPGVHIHFHDIYYPFEYPRWAVEKGISWNEAYVLRALLTDNPHLEIVLFNSYLERCHRERVAASLPLWDRNPGGSLWLRRR